MEFEPQRYKVQTAYGTGWFDTLTEAQTARRTGTRTRRLQPLSGPTDSG